MEFFYSPTPPPFFFRRVLFSHQNTISTLTSDVFILMGHLPTMISPSPSLSLSLSAFPAPLHPSSQNTLSSCNTHNPQRYVATLVVLIHPNNTPAPSFFHIHTHAPPSLHSASALCPSFPYWEHCMSFPPRCFETWPRVLSKYIIFLAWSVKYSSCNESDFIVIFIYIFSFSTTE